MNEERVQYYLSNVGLFLFKCEFFKYVRSCFFIERFFKRMQQIRALTKTKITNNQFHKYHSYQLYAYAKLLTNTPPLILPIITKGISRGLFPSLIYRLICVLKSPLVQAICLSNIKISLRTIHLLYYYCISSFAFVYIFYSSEICSIYL